jgi:hypothetical protein
MISRQKNSDAQLASEVNDRRKSYALSWVKTMHSMRIEKHVIQEHVGILSNEIFSYILKRV